jgi:hypothetical protein
VLDAAPVRGHVRAAWPRHCVQFLHLRAFERLGIAGEIMVGKIRGTEPVLREVINRLADLPDPAQRAALAAQLFGEEAEPRLGGLLAEGRAGIQALSDQAPVLADAQVRAAQQIPPAHRNRRPPTVGASIGVELWSKHALLNIPIVWQRSSTGGGLGGCIDDCAYVIRFTAQLPVAR